MASSKDAIQKAVEQGVHTKAPANEELTFWEGVGQVALDLLGSVANFFGGQPVINRVEKLVNGGESLEVSNIKKAYAEASRLVEQVYDVDLPKAPTQDNLQKAQDTLYAVKSHGQQLMRKSFLARNVSRQRRLDAEQAVKQQQDAYNKDLSNYEQKVNDREKAINMALQSANAITTAAAAEDKSLGDLIK